MAGDKLLQKFLLKLKTSNIQFSQIFWSKDFNFLLFNSLFMKIMTCHVTSKQTLFSSYFCSTRKKMGSLKTFAHSVKLNHTQHHK